MISILLHSIPALHGSILAQRAGPGAPIMSAMRRLSQAVQFSLTNGPERRREEKRGSFAAENSNMKTLFYLYLIYI